MPIRAGRGYRRAPPQARRTVVRLAHRLWRANWVWPSRELRRCQQLHVCRMLQKEDEAVRGPDPSDGQGHDFTQTAPVQHQRVSDTLLEDTMPEEGEGDECSKALPIWIDAREEEPSPEAQKDARLAEVAAFREGKLREIEAELEALRLAEVNERAAAAHQHQCAARAYEAAMQHVQRAEGLGLRIKELGWQRDTAMELAHAKPPGAGSRRIPSAPRK